MDQYFINNVINIQPTGMPGTVSPLFGSGMNAAASRCQGMSGMPAMPSMAGLSPAMPTSPFGGGSQCSFLSELLGLMVGLLTSLTGGRGLQGLKGSQAPGAKPHGTKPHGKKPHHPSAGRASGAPAAQGGNLPRQVGGAPKGTFHARGTGYYPANNALEGGFKDKRGHKLNTLQDFLSGKAPYVSVAMDSGVPYGSVLRIPELEKKYHRPIVFRVVDTGGAFQGKGHSRVDVCVRDQQSSLDSTINGPLTLNFV